MKTEEEAGAEFIRDFGKFIDAVHAKIQVRSDELTGLIQPGYSRPIKVYYSAYPEKNGKEVDNLGEVCAEGKVRFRHKDTYKFGNGKTFLSPILVNPTWLDAAIMADAMIRYTQDEHHIFFEGIRFFKEIDGCRIYNFCMGS